MNFEQHIEEWFREMKGRVPNWNNVHPFVWLEQGLEGLRQRLRAEVEQAAVVEAKLKEEVVSHLRLVETPVESAPVVETPAVVDTTPVDTAPVAGTPTSVESAPGDAPSTPAE